MAIYIYSLRCPLSNEIRYVGKTEYPETRLKSHIKRARTGDTKHRTAHWIRKVLAAGLSPTMEILAEVDAGTRWQDLERQYIAEAAGRGWKLTNSTPGGEGISITDDPDATKRRKEAQKRTMARPEVREKWLAAQQAARETPETKKARAAGVKASWSDPETRARYIAGMATPEATANRAAATKARFDDAEKLAIHSKKMKEIWSTPERKEEARVRAIAVHADPEIVERRRASLKIAANRPETKAKLAEAMKEVNARPEVKAKRSSHSKANWADPSFRAKMHGESSRTKMSHSAKARWTKDRPKMMATMADPGRRARMSELMKIRNADPAFAAKARGPEARAKQGLAMKENWAQRKAALAASQ